METTEQKQKKISKTLERLKKKEHLPQDLIHLLGQITGLQLEAHQGVSLELPDLDLSGLSSRVECGGSFLTLETETDTLPLDKTQAFALFSRIVSLVMDPSERVPEAMRKATADIADGIEMSTLDFGKAVDECLAGTGPTLKAWSERTPEAPGALRFLILASLEPSFHAVSSMLSERLHGHGIDGGIRQTGTCPVCGNLPYILELRGTEGFRFAVCSMCRHEYRIRRIACPVCDTTDTEKLRFFTVEEEPGFRVETCDNCSTYLKTIDFRGMDREPFPALNDLESLALDFLAVEQGLTRATPSVWGI